MAFGIDRNQLEQWKALALRGEIAFLTHFWLHPRWPQYKTVTKAGCCDVEKLKAWGSRYGLLPEWIDRRSDFPHFDLLGERQKEILQAENCWRQIEKFRL